MRSSIEIDPEFVKRLARAQLVCLAVSGGVASLILAAWFVPALGRMLPAFWSLTKANTALAGLLATLGLGLAHPGRSKAVRVLSRALLAMAGAMAVLVLVEYLFHASFRIELLLPYDHASPTLGRMAPPTALNFALLALVALLMDQYKTLLATVADLAVSVLAVSVLINTSGSIFGAIRLFGFPSNMVAPSTMVCLVLLTFVACSRRAERGVFSLMLGLGLGSRVARLAFPLAILLPFALEMARFVAVRKQLLSPEYASAVATTLAVLLAVGLLFALAERMLRLEKDILDLSLRDELTTLYNRRGFFLMAEQALSLAQRSSLPFSVLFVDLDGLKRINDTHGHDTGSEFIREAAHLLEQVVRRTDIVGRVGGDEFVVAGISDAEGMSTVIDRLRAVAKERNARPGRLYPFSLSLGHASSAGHESLDDLLQQADIAMYESKHRKKVHRA